MANGDMVVVIGGDGTFLSAVKERWRDNPIFAPINSGNLGFFSEYNYADVKKFIQMLREEKYHIVEYPLYEVEITQKNGQIIKDVFVNDVSIKQDGAKAVHLQVKINDKVTIPYSADGLVVSTSLGSTAYNMSLGGALMFDHIPNFQISPIAQMHNRSYSGVNNSVMIKDDSVIEITPNFKKKRHFYVVCDSREIKCKYGIQSVKIINKGKTFKLLRSEEFNFQDNIKNKIL